MRIIGFFLMLLGLGFLSLSFSEEFRILAILKTPDNTFFREIEKGINDAVENLRRNGERVEKIIKFGNSEADIESQRKILRLFAGRKVDCVIITPARYDRNLMRLLKRYKKRKKAVVIDVDTPIESEVWDYRIYSDNELGGYCEVKKLVEIAKKKGFNKDIKKSKFLLIGGVPTSGTSRARMKGYKKALKELGVKNITEIYGNWRREIARRLVKNKFPGEKYDFIIAANDNMAIGAVEALKSLRVRIPPPYIGGFDFIPSVKRYIKMDLIHLSVSQDPYAMGYIAVYACLKTPTEAVKFKNINFTREGKDIKIGVYARYKENLNSPVGEQCKQED